MNFSDKLNKIFTVLNCSNFKIASECGIDPSIISRFRSGVRTPNASSMQLIKLCGGIASYALENELWEPLIKECGFDNTDKPEEDLYKYLYITSLDTINKHAHIKPRQGVYYFFGEKLNALMNMLDVTNIRLARSLNVDSSLISRFRNGLRTPPKNSELTIKLCSYLYKRVIEGSFETEFAELLDITNTLVINGGDLLLNSFVDWISNNTETQNSIIMDSFLEKIEAISLTHQKPPILSSGNPFCTENKEQYIGLQGLREAVIRFLSLVAYSTNTHTLKLYSDQNMEWLAANALYMQKWAALMYTVLYGGKHVKIIHNVERSLPEMLVAIEKWLPLYMTGMIEAYYCKKPHDGRFAHTIFVAHGLAAINASLVSGTEDSGKYAYITDLDGLSNIEVQIDALIEISKPLIQVFNNQRIDEFNFKKGEMAKQSGETKRLLLSLSIASIPIKLLKKMLIRNNITEEETNKILMLHKISAMQFQKELQSGSIVEYVCLPEKEALVSGKITLNLADLFLCQVITYTPNEYAEHISAIVSLLIKNSNYNIVLLPDIPFAHIQIQLKKDMGVMIVKNDDPTMAFWFGHPMMCQAFFEYFHNLSKKSKTPVNNKNSLIKLLKTYYNT